MKRAIIIEVIVFLFVILFLYAAGTKLVQYNQFIGQMGKSPLITKYAEWLAWLVPSIEILIALMLVIPKSRLVGLYSAFGLMVAFTLYIIAILTISEKLPCACGGVLSSLGWKEHLIFNIFFVLLGMAGVILQIRQNDNVGKEVITG